MSSIRLDAWVLRQLKTGFVQKKGCGAIVEFTEKDDDDSSANDIWLRCSYPGGQVDILRYTRE